MGISTAVAHKSGMPQVNVAWGSTQSAAQFQISMGKFPKTLKLKLLHILITKE
jgi:hypothetical protein